MENQLQELEALIRQRRLYLTGQDNQIQRNQELLNKQKSSLSLNEADLKQQRSKLDGYTTDSENALEALKKQAEREPSKRVIELRKLVGKLNGEMLSLSLAKTEITNFLAGAVDTLSRQDSEIIEADAIHKELLDQISIAKGKLRQAERDATFQVAIVSDLQNDVNGLTQQYTKLEASLIFSKQEQERVGKLVKTAQAKLDTLSNEILSCESQLKGLQLEASKVTKSLKQAGKSDKVIREALANKELKLQEEKTNLKVQKADIKKDLLAKQQLQPKPAVPIKDRLKGYYQI